MIMLNSSTISMIGARVLRVVLSTGKCSFLSRAGCPHRHYSQYFIPMCKVQPEPKVLKNLMFQLDHFSTGAAEGEKETETINVTFVEKDGEERHIKVPVGMSILEAAHESDIELEGIIIDKLSSCACEGSLACSTCHVIVMDPLFYNRLDDPTDEENDMLDLAFGLSETSRLGCQIIATRELDGLRLAIPAATRHFSVDGFVPKPH